MGVYRDRWNHPGWRMVGHLSLLVILTLVALLIDRREHYQAIADLKRGQEDHSREHGALVRGTIALFERLATLSNAIQINQKRRLSKPRHAKLNYWNSKSQL